MVNETIGIMVATIRGFKGISQAKLAKDSLVPHAYISRMENGKMVLSKEHLARLEAALGVDFAAIRPAFEQFAAVLREGSNNGKPKP